MKNTSTQRLQRAMGVLFIASWFIMSAMAQRPSLTVNPFVGTDYTGNTYPGAQLPFGMVQLSPDNGLPGWDRIAGYFHPDSTIAGFSHTHLLGTGAGDMYDISYLPAHLPLRTAEPPLGTHSRFLHSSEEAHAGYYAVTLDDYGIRVELTATERVGIQRYTRSRKQPLLVLLNLGKDMNWDATEGIRLEVVNDSTIMGYRFSTGWARHQRVYFASRFSRVWENLDRGLGDSICAFSFSPMLDTLEVYTALSATSTADALANLEAEAPFADFNFFRSRAERTWDAALSRVSTPTPSPILSTALYHSLLCPTLQSNAKAQPYYETFSLWDTYRAQHPLLTLLQPQRAADMVRSIIEFGERQGRLPVWNMWGSETDMMIGYHAAAVIADAHLKGLISDSLARRGLALSVQTANLYNCGDYVPMHHRDLGGNDWSLSRTLEYAYDDACIARLATSLGEKAVAREFRQRAQRYRHVFNPRTGFFQPRDSMGHWQKDFHPGAFTPFICESNAWPYLFNVQHDIRGLRRLLGGRRALRHRLDQLFSTPDADSLPIFSTGKIGQYVHGNEPSHHIAYLYNFARRPQKTRDLVTRICQEMYANTPAGLCGNEDCGQMSAWYVFAAMGFYPVDPCGGTYSLGIPQQDRLTLALPNGRTLLITRREGRRSRVTLNGRRLRHHRITHQQLLQGGRLEFVVCH